VVALPENTPETCDQCPGEGTPGRVLVTLVNGGQITFCQHHADSNGFVVTVVNVPSIADML
jgi:hypothetical protein